MSAEVSTPTSEAPVLLVENDTAQAQLTSRLLSRQNPPVRSTHVGNGWEALEYLQRRGRFEDAPRPGLVLMELNLPGMDGHQLLATIRAEPDLATLPIVVLASSTSQDDIDQCYELRANSYAIKSLDIRELSNTIQACTDFWLRAASPPAEPEPLEEEEGGETLLSECVECMSPIPYIRMSARRPAVKWECAACGATFQGRLVDQSGSTARENLKPVWYYLGGGKLPLATAVLKYAHDMADDRRSAPRQQLVLPVPTLKLDEDFYPVGEPFTMISRNISASGIALLHTEPISGHFAIGLKFPRHGEKQFVVEALRSVPVGPFFEVAGKFAQRMTG